MTAPAQTTWQQQSCLAWAAFPGGLWSPIGPKSLEGKRHTFRKLNLLPVIHQRNLLLFSIPQNQWNIYITIHLTEKMENIAGKDTTSTWGVSGPKKLIKLHCYLPDIRLKWSSTFYCSFNFKVVYTWNMIYYISMLTSMRNCTLIWIG